MILRRRSAAPRTSAFCPPVTGAITGKLYPPKVSHQVIAVAETDSFLKWSVRLLAQLPATTEVEILIARSPLRPSPAQRVAALAGTAHANHEPEVLSPGQLRQRVERDRPDAVLLACTGPSVRAYQVALSRASHRPVLIAGIPGIALPARRRAWAYRGAIDLFVVHSRREVAEYDRMRMLTGRRGRVGLATIPFLAPAAPGPLPGPAPKRPKNRVVFATQALVPARREERIEILLALDRLAADRPDLNVVVKTRGLSGEFHSHHEAHHYADLWNELVESGRVGNSASLEFAAGAMAEQLLEAVALVTVSSTAVLEAMALDLPVLLIDEFGIGADSINQVFVGSNCLDGLDALREAKFRHPQQWWREENYFHPAADDTWIDELDALVSAAAAGRLPAIAEGLDGDRSSSRQHLDRLRLSPAGSALVRARQRLKKHLRRVNHPGPGR